MVGNCKGGCRVVWLLGWLLGALELCMGWWVLLFSGAPQGPVQNLIVGGSVGPNRVLVLFPPLTLYGLVSAAY